MDGTYFNQAAVEAFLEQMKRGKSDFETVLSEIESITTSELHTAWSGEEYDVYQGDVKKMTDTLRNALETLVQEIQTAENKNAAFVQAKQNSINR